MSKRVVSLITSAAVLAGGYTAVATPEPATEPITLRIGTDDVPGRPAADQIEEFARQVDELSGGVLVIEPVWKAAGEGLDDWDQQVARMVVAGDLDMGNIPARTWDTEGVDTFRALHAPFLVSSNELLDRVVADDVAGEMLAGLDEIGLSGLALLPEGMRYVFSFGEPLLTPEAFAGITVRAPTSETTHALFGVLGAEVDDFGGEDFGAAVDEGVVAAAESSFIFAGCCLPASTVAANVPLFPKANVIVVNSDVLAGLTAEQQDVLRAAAAATREWSIDVDVDEAELAATFCLNGGTVVAADTDDIEAMRRAAEPVYAELEHDEQTSAMIDRISELARDVGPGEEIAPCDSTTVSPPAQPTEPPASVPSETAAASEFPEGVYEMEITAEFLIEAGVDRATAFSHAGIWTLTFTDGVLTIHDVNASTGRVHDDPGVYCVAGGRVSVGILGSPCGDFWSAGWTLEGDQLQFVDLESHVGEDLLIETLFGGQPWTKVE